MAAFFPRREINEMYLPFAPLRPRNDPPSTLARYLMYDSHDKVQRASRSSIIKPRQRSELVFLVDIVRYC